MTCFRADYKNSWTVRSLESHRRTVLELSGIMLLPMRQNSRHTVCKFIRAMAEADSCALLQDDGEHHYSGMMIEIMSRRRSTACLGNVFWCHLETNLD